MEEKKKPSPIRTAILELVFAVLFAGFGVYVYLTDQIFVLFGIIRLNFIAFGVLALVTLAIAIVSLVQAVKKREE